MAKGNKPVKPSLPKEIPISEQRKAEIDANKVKTFAKVENKEKPDTTSDGTKLKGVNPKE